jgi:hypothetical protein
MTVQHLIDLNEFKLEKTVPDHGTLGEFLVVRYKYLRFAVWLSIEEVVMRQSLKEKIKQKIIHDVVIYYNKLWC